MARPSNKKPPADARWAAVDLLRAVLRRKRPLDQALEESEELKRLAPRDRAFARNLVATALRRLHQIDALLAVYVTKPLPDPQGYAKDLLRFGALQLIFFRTPPHAAVSNAVMLAERAGVGHLKGLINAVLRRVAGEGTQLAATQDEQRLALPDWLWESWVSAYGEATVRSIASVLLTAPPLDLTVKAAPDEWAARLGATLLPTGTLRLAETGNVTELAGYDEGAWWVQDAAASLPARLLGDVRDLRVADIAAAPGGKTAQLAAAGALVTAIDRSALRLVRLQQNLARLGLAADCRAIDATEFDKAEGEDSLAGSFDAVLLDAPCSATGTARRHPDVLHLKRTEEVTKLAALQDRLLAASLTLLRPGGLLVYCTCSLEAAEGPERIARLIDSGAPVVREPIRAEEVGGLTELVTPQGDLRTLPCHLADRGGLDGFYAARLRLSAGAG